MYLACFLQQFKIWLKSYFIYFFHLIQVMTYCNFSIPCLRSRVAWRGATLLSIKKNIGKHLDKMFKHGEIPALVLPLHFSRISVNPSRSVKWGRILKFLHVCAVYSTSYHDRMLYCDMAHETRLVDTIECLSVDSSLCKCKSFMAKGRHHW